MQRRLYDSQAWRDARKAYLTDNPLCAMCRQAGRLVPASVVDHIKPHRDDPELFWDVDNWQALCKAHHDSAKQRQDKRGHVIGCDVNGNPLGGWRA